MSCCLADMGANSVLRTLCPQMLSDGNKCSMNGSLPGIFNNHSLECIYLRRYMCEGRTVVTDIRQNLRMASTIILVFPLLCSKYAKYSIPSRPHSPLQI